MKHILKIENLTKVYPKSNFKLNNISFSIPYGSIVGFIGVNGSGKTTTMGAILNLLKKDSGHIQIFGKEMNKRNIEMKENIGVVFDSINFSENLNVTQLCHVMKNVYRQWDMKTFFHYIDYFSLPRKDKIKGFSRGMAMKLSIAVALSHNAKLLILDEATAGLDPVTRDDVLDVLLNFVNDKKGSILLSSHITSDIEKIADKLIFIKRGAIIFKVTKKELLHNYSIIQCHPNELHAINNNNIVAYKHQHDYVDMLVKNKKDITATFHEKDFSIDGATLLLMRGEVK